MAVIDIKNAQLVIGTHLIEGYAKGDAISYSTQARMSVVTDAHGKPTFIVNNDKTITLTVRLQASSPSNAFLSNLVNLGAAGIVNAVFTDFGSNTKISSLEACVNTEDGVLASDSERIFSWQIIFTEASMDIVN